MELEQAVQLIVQTGALGLLGYLIFWATRSGVPSIVGTMNGIREAIDANTRRLTSLERQHLEHSTLMREVIRNCPRAETPK